MCPIFGMAIQLFGMPAASMELEMLPVICRKLEMIFEMSILVAQGKLFECAFDLFDP